MAKRWSKTEISYLKRHAGATSLEELARRVHTDQEAVRTKLAELGLGPGRAADPAADPALSRFETALERFHAGHLAAAADLFEDVMAEADETQLADRARQYAVACRRKLADEADADPYLRAVYAKNRGDYDAARDLCARHGDGDARFVYLEASLAALGDDAEAALAKLRAAIDLDPKNRVQAYHDPDFEPLRGRDEFKSLLGAP